MNEINLVVIGICAGVIVGAAVASIIAAARRDPRIEAERKAARVLIRNAGRINTIDEALDGVAHRIEHLEGWTRSWREKAAFWRAEAANTHAELRNAHRGIRRLKRKLDRPSRRFGYICPACETIHPGYPEIRVDFSGDPKVEKPGISFRSPICGRDWVNSADVVAFVPLLPEKT